MAREQDWTSSKNWTKVNPNNVGKLKQAMEGTGDMSSAFQDFMKVMEAFKLTGAAAAAQAVRREGARAMPDQWQFPSERLPSPWKIIEPPHEPEEEEMSQDEYLLVLAERMFGCYTRIAHVSLHSVKCNCGYGKIKLEQMIEAGIAHHRAHAGICFGCSTLFIHLWDRKEE